MQHYQVSGPSTNEQEDEERLRPRTLATSFSRFVIMPMCCLICCTPAVASCFAVCAVGSTQCQTRRCRGNVKGAVKRRHPRTGAGAGAFPKSGMLVFRLEKTPLARSVCYSTLGVLQRCLCRRGRLASWAAGVSSGSSGLRSAASETVSMHGGEHSDRTTAQGQPSRLRALGTSRCQSSVLAAKAPGWLAQKAPVNSAGHIGTHSSFEEASQR